MLAASSPAVRNVSRQVLERFEEYVTLQRRIPQEVLQMATAGGDDERSACVLASHLAVRHEIRQRLLESPTLEELYEGLFDVISGELEILRLERKIDDEVRGSIFRNQREFYLQEQLRAIHRELGEDDADDVDELEAQIEVQARGVVLLDDESQAVGGRDPGVLARRLGRLFEIPLLLIAREFGHGAWLQPLP